MTTDILGQTISVLASVLPYILFASPATVFLSAMKCNSKTSTTITRGENLKAPDSEYIQMPPLALSSQTTQCLLFLLYSAVTSNIAGVIANAGGFFLGLVYLVLYPFFCDTSESLGLMRMYKCQVLASVAIGSGFVAGFFLTSEKDDHCNDSEISDTNGDSVSENPLNLSNCTVPSPDSVYANLLKWTALLFGLMLFAHPIFVLKDVLRGSMLPSAMGSFFMNLAAIACSGVWVAYAGFIKPDLVFLLQNAVGLGVNLAAIVVRSWVRNRARETPLILNPVV